ncbi:MAG: hypothetical protein ABIU63_16150 [Chitinophagaceae bacterium]
MQIPHRGTFASPPIARPKRTCSTVILAEAIGTNEQGPSNKWQALVATGFMGSRIMPALIDEYNTAIHPVVLRGEIIVHLLCGIKHKNRVPRCNGLATATNDLNTA